MSAFTADQEELHILSGAVILLITCNVTISFLSEWSSLITVIASAGNGFLLFSATCGQGAELKVKVNLTNFFGGSVDFRNTLLRSTGATDFHGTKCGMWSRDAI